MLAARARSLVEGRAGPSEAAAAPSRATAMVVSHTRGYQRFWTEVIQPGNLHSRLRLGARPLGA